MGSSEEMARLSTQCGAYGSRCQTCSALEYDHAAVAVPGGLIVLGGAVSRKENTCSTELTDYMYGDELFDEQLQRWFTLPYMYVLLPRREKPYRCLRALSWCTAASSGVARSSTVLESTRKQRRRQ